MDLTLNTVFLLLIFKLQLHSVASANHSTTGLASFVLKESLHGSCLLIQTQKQTIEIQILH